MPKHSLIRVINYYSGIFMATWQNLPAIYGRRPKNSRIKNYQPFKKIRKVIEKEFYDLGKI